MPDTPLPPEPPETPVERSGANDASTNGAATNGDGASLKDLYDDYLVRCDTALRDGAPLPPLPDELAATPFAQQAESGVRLLRLLARARDTVMGPEPAPQAGAAPLAHVGPFRLIRELGRGGHGVVYLAVDERLGRQVALKLSRPETLLDADLRKRFLREAQAASQLDHPQLVPVHEVGEESRLFYIASQYVEGKDLAQWLAEQTAPVPPRQAAELVAALADGVEHAHAHGILHRDIKPSNVLLSEEAGRLSARLTDFGLAKLLEATKDQTQTRTGVLLGTPTYMAPELATGKLREVGPATDIYGLGALLYEILTGRPPFRGENDVDTIYHTVHSEPLDPRRLRPGLSPELAAISLKCLDKRPAQRYATAAELAADLQRYLRGQPTLARPAIVFDHVWKWAKRRPAIAALSASLLTALTTLFVMSIWYAERLVESRDAASKALTEEKNSRAREQLVRAETVRAANSGRINRAQRLLEQDHPERARRILDGVTPTDEPLETGDARLLKQRASGELRRIQAHDGELLALSIDREGEHCATGGADKTVRIWQIATAAQQRALEGHAVPVHGVAFGDGDCVASGGNDTERSELFLWRWKSNKPPTPLEGPAKIVAVSFSQDGQWLVAAGSGPVTPGSASHAEIRFWKRTAVSAGDGENEWALSHTWRPEAEVANAAVFSADNQTLVVGLASASTGSVGLWDLSNGAPRGALSVHGPVRCVALSSDDRVLVATGGQAIEAWAWPTCQSLGRGFSGYYSPDEEATALTFRAGTTQVVTANKLQHGGRHRCSVRLWNAGEHVGLAAYLGTPAHHATALAQIDGGRLLLVGANDGSLRWWDTERSVLARFERAALPRIGSANFSKSGRQIVGDSAGSVFVMDTETWAARTLQLPNAEYAHHGTLVSAAFSADERLIVSGGAQDGRLKVWDAVSGALLADLPAHDVGMRSLAVSPTRPIAATSGRDNMLRLWDLSRFVQTAEHKSRDLLRSLAFSPDGHYLASAGADGVLDLWSGIDGRHLQGWEHDSELWSVAFSADGRVLAVGLGDGSIQTRGVDGRVLARVMGHEGDDAEANSLSFSSDGRLLASGSENESVVVWDYHSGIDTLSIPCPHSLEFVRFSPDGRRLVYGWRGGHYLGIVDLGSDTAPATPPGGEGEPESAPALATTGRARELATIFEFLERQQDGAALRRLEEKAHHADFAGFAGRYLSRLASRTRQSIRQQPGAITSFDVTSDGTVAVCGDDNGEIMVYDLPRGRFSPRLDAQWRASGKVGSCFFLPARPWFVSAGSEGAAELAWWKRDPPLVIRKTPLTRGLRAAAVSPDGKQLAVLEGRADDGTHSIALIDVQKQEVVERRELRAADPQAAPDWQALLFANSSRTLVLAGGSSSGQSEQAVLASVEVSAGSEPTQVAFDGPAVSAIALAPNGSTLATAAPGDGVRLWRWPPSADRPPVRLNVPGTPTMTFSPDSSKLATGYRVSAPLGYKSQIHLWDVDKGNQLACLASTIEGSIGLRFTPDGRSIVQAGDYRAVRMLATDHPDYEILNGLNAPVLAAAFSVDGKTLSAISREGHVAWWHLHTKSLQRHVELVKGPVAAAAFLDDCRKVAIGKDSRLEVFSLTDGRLSGNGVDLGVEAVSLGASQGENVVVGGADGALRWWDGAARRIAASWRISNDPISSVAMGGQDDDRLVGVGGSAAFVTARSTATRTHTFQLGGVATAATLSPNARFWAVGLQDGRIALWSVDQFSRIAASPGRASPVNALNFSSDGRVLAAASQSGEVVLYDGESLELLFPLVSPMATVSLLQCSPDGTRIAAGLSDGRVVLWETP